MAENINEALLNRHTLSGPDEESRAAGELRESHAQERIGDDNPEEEKPQGTTPRQILSAAKKQGAPKAPSAGASSGSNPLSAVTSQTLKQSWPGLLETFGATLIYINLHVFGHSVLGEKVFCELGEEWIPDNLRSNMESPKVKSMIKKIGLLEKMVLIFLDFLALMALLAGLAGFVLIGSVVSGHFDVIIKMGWSLIRAILAMFNPDVQT